MTSKKKPQHSLRFIFRKIKQRKLKKELDHCFYLVSLARYFLKFTVPFTIGYITIFTLPRCGEKKLEICDFGNKTIKIMFGVRGSLYQVLYYSRT